MEILIIGCILFYLFSVMFADNSRTLSPATKKVAKGFGVAALALWSFETVRALVTGK